MMQQQREAASMFEHIPCVEELSLPFEYKIIDVRREKSMFFLV